MITIKTHSPYKPPSLTTNKKYKNNSVKTISQLDFHYILLLI